MVQDYTTPEGKVMSRDLTQQLNAAITFLVECRPISVSMGNTIKFLKLQVGPSAVVMQCIQQQSADHGKHWGGHQSSWFDCISVLHPAVVIVRQLCMTGQSCCMGQFDTFPTVPCLTRRMRPSSRFQSAHAASASRPAFLSQKAS